MKVLFVLPHLVAGGVARIRLILMEHLIAAGIDCRLAVRRKRGELLRPAQNLVPVNELAPHGMHQFVPALVGLLRKERPTHIVSAFPDVGALVWIARKLSGSNATWVHSVHGTHAAAARRPGWTGAARTWCDHRAAGFVYRRAEAIVAVSDGLRDEIVDGFGISATKVVKIYNPAIPDEMLAQTRIPTSLERKLWRIVAIGRLSEEKSFTTLISAMASVPGCWRLDIWGDGPEREKLSILIRKSGMLDKVRLRGYTDDPFAVLREADIYVLSSTNEGLSNTLIEAMAAQCQLIATDCHTGPREVLLDGKLGQLVPILDEQALATAIVRSINGSFRVDPGRMLQRAEAFGRSKCCGEWQRLLQSAGRGAAECHNAGAAAQAKKGC